MVKQNIGLGFVLALAVACNVESTDPGTGGVTDEPNPEDEPADGETSADNNSADGGSADGGSEPAPPARECPRGVSVVMSDYVSTQVALSNLEGETQSASFISSASSTTAGLAFALSGDVRLPGAAPASGRVVLIDRYGTDVITWVDPSNAEVLGQLSVGTGFTSNPQDYIEISDTLAFVSRFEQNEGAGTEDFDRGGDVLVIDIENFEILNAIELPIEDDLPPRPSSMFRLGDSVLINMNRLALDFSSTGEAMWASLSIATEEIEWVETLDGLKECGRPALSPDGTRLAMACTGALGPDGAIEDIGQSVIRILDASTSPPEEIERFAAEDLVGEPVQGDVEYASDNVLLFKTQTPYSPGEGNNRWMALTLDSGDVTELLEARADDMGLGKGIVYGSILCAPGCSDVCLMSDADRGVLQRVRVEADDLTLLDSIEVETSVGLPPVDLTFR